jgi:hypothetical protein
MVFHLRAELLAEGFTLTQFAKIHGHKYSTVQKVIRRHVGRNSRPRGKETLLILANLSKYTRGDRHEYGDPTTA